MAYLRDATRRCTDCGKTAVVELVNRWNSTYGFYCRSHGDKRLAELQRSEAADKS
jgi:hypothetical protein